MQQPSSARPGSTPWQPRPKMHVHREHSQVRSARIRCSASAGSKNSTHSRGKSSGRLGDDIVGFGTRREYARVASVRGMRLGVLDVGSNTVHLLVVDAHRGAQPTPQLSHKSELRLAEHIDKRRRPGRSRRRRPGRRGDRRAQAGQGARLRRAARVRDVGGARRRATRAEVLERVARRGRRRPQVLTGEDEARLTFLAVRRWLGWSAGNLICLDIGGGSLELGAGTDEDPAVADLAAARRGPADPRVVRRRPAGQGRRRRAARVRRRRAGTSRPRSCSRPGDPTGSSPPARRSARWPGWPARRRARPGRRAPHADPHRADPGHRVHLADDRGRPRRAGRRQPGARTRRWPARSSPPRRWTRSRSTELELCPWALREGVILRRLDWLTGG